MLLAGFEVSSILVKPLYGVECLSFVCMGIGGTEFWRYWVSCFV
jgi:hypothetical protein